MARLTLPDPVEKRNILHGGKATQATIASFGEAFERAGRLADAFEFFVKAKHDAGLERLKAFALENGHSFLLLRLRRSGLREIAPGEWSRAAETAEKAGRLQDALWCEQESGDALRLEALRERIRASQPSGNGAEPAAVPKPPI
jgi:hypothetical protein